MHPQIVQLPLLSRELGLIVKIHVDLLYSVFPLDFDGPERGGYFGGKIYNGGEMVGVV